MTDNYRNRPERTIFTGTYQKEMKDLYNSIAKERIAYLERQARSIIAKLHSRADTRAENVKAMLAKRKEIKQEDSKGPVKPDLEALAEIANDGCDKALEKLWEYCIR